MPCLLEARAPFGKDPRLFAYEPLHGYSDERDAVALPWARWEAQARSQDRSVADLLAAAGRVRGRVPGPGPGPGRRLTDAAGVTRGPDPAAPRRRLVVLQRLAELREASFRHSQPCGAPARASLPGWPQSGQSGGSRSHAGTGTRDAAWPIPRRACADSTVCRGAGGHRRPGRAHLVTSPVRRVGTTGAGSTVCPWTRSIDRTATRTTSTSSSIRSSRPTSRGPNGRPVRDEEEAAAAEAGAIGGRPFDDPVRTNDVSAGTPTPRSGPWRRPAAAGPRGSSSPRASFEHAYNAPEPELTPDGVATCDDPARTSTRTPRTWSRKSSRRRAGRPAADRAPRRGVTRDAGRRGGRAALHGGDLRPGQRAGRPGPRARACRWER